MKVKIDNSTYIILLISFLAGYFEYMYLFLLTIFIHESGHVIFGNIVNFKYSKIIIYPFGGLTIYNEDLNVNTNKELFALLGGITFQLLFYFFIVLLHNNSFITDHVFEIIKRINILLISFNFLPILPLDGGKLLNILFDKLLSYKLSNKISLFISFIMLIIFLINNRTLFSLLLVIFLLKCLCIEINNLKLKYNRFLLERHLNDYNFKHIKHINNINDFKRDYYHIIDNISEKKYLHNIFYI